MENVNYFGTRDEYMFICYKDMIKFTYPVLLYNLIKDYYDDLKDYLNLDEIKDYDIFNLERICVERLDINPLKYLKKPGCPDSFCDDLLKTFNTEMNDLYTKSRLSDFGAKMYNIFKQDRIKEFYIYIEEPAEQMIIDCHVHFPDFQDRIKYLTGDFIQAVMCVPHKPTCYVLNDINYLHKLIDTGIIEFSEVILGDLGCNYELDEEFMLKLKGIEDNTMKEKIFKLAVVPIAELKAEHFSQLVIGENDNKSTE